MVKAKEKNTIRYEKEDVKIGPVIGISVVLIMVFITLLVFLSNYFIGSKEEMVYERQLKPESTSLNEILMLVSLKFLNSLRSDRINFSPIVFIHDSWIYY